MTGNKKLELERYQKRSCLNQCLRSTRQIIFSLSSVLGLLYYGNSNKKSTDSWKPMDFCSHNSFPLDIKRYRPKRRMDSWGSKTLRIPRAWYDKWYTDYLPVNTMQRYFLFKFSLLFAFNFLSLFWQFTYGLYMNSYLMMQRLTFPFPFVHHQTHDKLLSVLETKEISWWTNSLNLVNCL